MASASRADTRAPRPQDELGGSEEDVAQLRRVLDMVPNGVAVFDASMTLLAASPQYLAMTALDASAIGRNIYESVADIPPAWREAHRRCLAGETLLTDEDVWVRDGAAPRRFNWELRPWRGASGQILGLILKTDDVTERHAAAAALRESRERLDAALAALGTGTFRWDVATGRLEWDANLRALFGVRPEEEIRTLDDFFARVHPEDRESVVAMCERCAREGGPFTMEFRVSFPDGSVRWIDDRGTMYTDAAGRPAYMTGACIDVTDRKLATAALADEARRKDEFLAVLAHELRNPLAPIRYAADLLRSLERKDPRLTRPREVLERQTQHMARLVDDLLDMSRITRGKVQLEALPVDLASLVRDVTSDYARELEKAGITLRTELPPEPIIVDGDATRLAQLLSNLLRNACKFTDAGGSVTVSLESSASDVVLRVEDTGVGIDAAMLPRLFQPFTQVESTTGRSIGGLGLGLALVRGIAELHGGTAEARSDGLGRGTEIRVTLRRRPADEARPTESSAAVSPRPTVAARKLRLVVVDDYEDGLEMAVAMVEMAGHEVVAQAREGYGAIEAIRREQPDGVLCDIGLPGEMDGYAVARAIRADPGLASIRLVALTGYGQESDRTRARDAGFDDHLLKPVNFAQLAALFDG